MVKTRNDEIAEQGVHDGMDGNFLTDLAQSLSKGFTLGNREEEEIYDKNYEWGAEHRPSWDPFEEGQKNLEASAREREETEETPEEEDSSDTDYSSSSDTDYSSSDTDYSSSSSYTPSSSSSNEGGGGGLVALLLVAGLGFGLFKLASTPDKVGPLNTEVQSSQVQTEEETKKSGIYGGNISQYENKESQYSSNDGKLHDPLTSPKRSPQNYSTQIETENFHGYGNLSQEETLRNSNMIREKREFMRTYREQARERYRINRNIERETQRINREIERERYRINRNMAREAQRINRNLQRQSSINYFPHRQRTRVLFQPRERTRVIFKARHGNHYHYYSNQ